jgi:hypothetical protein
MRFLRSATLREVDPFERLRWPKGAEHQAEGLAREELLIEIDAWGFIDDPE